MGIFGWFQGHGDENPQKKNMKMAGEIVRGEWKSTSSHRMFRRGRNLLIFGAKGDIFGDWREKMAFWACFGLVFEYGFIF